MTTQPLAMSDLRIHLTRKEERLLRLLAENPGRCFSRKYLLTVIWGYSADARSRTVDVHIRRLRKKLENYPEWKILTIFGQGYLLQPPLDQTRPDTWPGIHMRLAATA